MPCYTNFCSHFIVLEVDIDSFYIGWWDILCRKPRTPCTTPLNLIDICRLFTGFGCLRLLRRPQAIMIYGPIALHVPSTPPGTVFCLLMVISVCLLYIYDMVGVGLTRGARTISKRTCTRYPRKRIDRRNIVLTHVRHSSVEIWRSYMYSINCEYKH